MADAKAIITEAANRYGVDPKIEWGVFGVESSYGHDPSTSSAGAEGPMQLEPSTARSVGVKNPQDLKEAALGAARYLAQYKSRGLTGMLSAYNAGPAGGIQQDYSNKVLAASNTYGSGGGVVPQAATTSTPATAPLPGLKTPSPLPGTTFDKEGFEKAEKRAVLGKLIAGEGGQKENPLFATGLISTKAPTTAEYTKTANAPVPRETQSPASRLSGTAIPRAGSGYVDPFTGDNVTPERIDQGVDYALQPGQAIRAIGDGVVKGIEPNWYAGQPFIWYELTSGPDKGKNVYVAEQIAPSVKAGDRVRAGQAIGSYARSGTGIETGFATPSGSTLATATGGYTEGQRTAAGNAFSQFMREVGAPEGLGEGRPTVGQTIAENKAGKVVRHPSGQNLFYPR